jgi:hypothetical protein
MSFKSNVFVAFSIGFGVLATACGSGAEPAPQPTESTAIEAIAKGCYHCTTTCTGGPLSTTLVSTDYTSCGVSSAAGAVADGPAACVDQFGCDQWNNCATTAQPPNTQCQYAGPSPAPAPSSTTQQ